jgi:hypothetical protein
MQVDLETLISAHSDSPANQSAKQESKKASQMTGGSGMKLLEYYKLANRNGSLLKMLKVLLPSKTAFCSNIVSLVWKLKVTKYNRLLFLLVPKTHHTEDQEFGSLDSLLPTPTTQEIEHPEATLTKNNRRLSKDGKSSHSLNLADTMKLWPTPTAMDTKEDGLKHATKILQGKTHRASGQPIQKTLSDKIMMDLIMENPELMEIYQDHQIEERPYLPTQQEFVDYLRMQTTIKELAANTNIKRTTIEHWFRKDKKGFSYPSIEDWQQIKPLLKTIQFDQEMTTIQTKEWKTKNQMWPTPTASDVEGGIAKDVQIANGRFFRQNEKGEKWGVKLRDAVNHTEEKKLWPTPRASIGMTMGLSENMAKLRHKRYLETEMAYEIHKDKTMFPTPTANEDAAGKPEGKMQKMLGNDPKVRNTGVGTLNSEWVTWLMGYPEGYLDISTENQNIYQELPKEKKTEPKS